MSSATKQLLDWIAIPSITGAEGDYGDALARELARLGLDVERQELAPGRFNVLARAGRPEIVFCTHLDTVPPWVAPREDREFVHGRGACDAKGQALAMLDAARMLLAQDETRFGLLFTVGEETDSAGASLANARLAEPWNPHHVIVGEPTDNRFVRAGKGTFKGKLVARGEAGHSSQDLGPSALHELIGCAHRLLGESWGEDPLLGRGSLNIGTLHGGVAPNVIAEQAEAELMIRTVEPIELVRARVERCLGAHVQLASSAKGYGPVRFEVPADEDGITIAFGTDVPYMPRFGTPLLFGPGSIRDAHTDHEKVKKSDIDLAAARHVRTVRELLARSER